MLGVAHGMFILDTHWTHKAQFPPPCIVSGRAQWFPGTPKGTYPKIPPVTVPWGNVCPARARRAPGALLLY